MTQLLILDNSFVLNSDEWCERFRAACKKQTALPVMRDLRAKCAEERQIRVLRDEGIFEATISVGRGNESPADLLFTRHVANEQACLAATILKEHGVLIVMAGFFGLSVPGGFEVNLEALAFSVEIGADCALGHEQAIIGRVMH